MQDYQCSAVMESIRPEIDGGSFPVKHVVVPRRSVHGHARAECRWAHNAPC